MENDKTEEEQQYTTEGGWDDASGYCAVVQAAANVVIGASDGPVHNAAGKFLISEFKRWTNYDLGGESS